MTKYATGYPASGALTGAETLQVVRAGADLQAAVSDIVAANPPSQNNLLINADGQINQMGFAGGALAAGVYGYDMHKAGTGGCNVSVASTGVWTHTSGPLVQVLELPQLASQVVTASVYDPTGNITITIDGVSGTITAGSGQRSVSITVPSGSTGNVTYTRTATGVTYSRPKLERGSIATPWNSRSIGTELNLCQRYLWKTFDLSMAPVQNSGSHKGALSYIASVNGAVIVGFGVRFPVRMRAAPSLTFYSPMAATSNWYNRSVGAASGAPQVAFSETSESGFTVVNTQVSGDAVSNTITVHCLADARL